MTANEKAQVRRLLGKLACRHLKKQFPGHADHDADEDVEEQILAVVKREFCLEVQELSSQDLIGPKDGKKENKPKAVAAKNSVKKKDLKVTPDAKELAAAAGRQWAAAYKAKGQGP